MPHPTSSIQLSRRRFLLRAGLAGIAVAGGSALVTACAEEGGGADTPRTGGRLRVAVPGRAAAVDTLDPHVAGSSAGGALSKNVWDKLVGYNNDLTLRHRLATALEPNEDGSQWRVTLRQGVTFSDGSPFTSRDVLWSLERMLEPDKPSSGDLSVVDLARTRADGDHAVVIALTEPLADLGSVLAGWYVYIIKDGTTDFDADNLPPGTGPFALASWAPGDRTVLTRNDRYWDGVARLDEVELIQLADPEARMNALLSGEVDVVHELTPLQARTVSGRDDLQVLEAPFGTMSAFQMRLDRAPFDDVRVRQALRLAIDREEIVEKVHLGYGEIGNDLYGKGAPHYASDLPQRTYDPTEARRLLKEAGKEDLRVDLHVADSSGMIETATLFKQHAAEAGITIDLVVSPADTYFPEVGGKEAFTYTGWWNYSLDYYYGQTTTSGAPGNDTGWERPEWDRTFAEARGALDEGRRNELYAELQEELWEEGGQIIHSFAKAPDGATTAVHGVPAGVPGTDDWASYRAAWLSS